MNSTRDPHCIPGVVVTPATDALDAFCEFVADSHRNTLRTTLSEINAGIGALSRGTNDAETLATILFLRAAALYVRGHIEETKK